MSSEYFTKTSLYWSDWKSLNGYNIFRRHLHQIKRKWASRNFVTESCENSRLITHSRSEIYTSYGFNLQMVNSLMGSWGIRLIAALAVKFKQRRLPSDCVDHYLIDQSIKRRFDNTPNTKEAPNTNLQYVSKLTEKVVFNQVDDHMVSNAIFSALQSS